MTRYGVYEVYEVLGLRSYEVTKWRDYEVMRKGKEIIILFW